MIRNTRKLIPPRAGAAGRRFAARRRCPRSARKKSPWIELFFSTLLAKMAEINECLSY
jgi:hypothetical protein